MTVTRVEAEATAAPQAAPRSAGGALLGIAFALLLGASVMLGSGIEEMLRYGANLDNPDHAEMARLHYGEAELTVQVLGFLTAILWMSVLVASISRVAESARRPALTMVAVACILVAIVVAPIAAAFFTAR